MANTKVIEYRYNEKTGALELWTHNVTLEEINELEDVLEKKTGLVTVMRERMPPNS